MSGHPVSTSRRKGAGSATGSSPGPGTTTKCTSRASASASRHLGSEGTVGADEVEQFRDGETRPRSAGPCRWCRRRRRGNLLLVYLAGALSGQGQAQKPQAQRWGGRFAGRLERGWRGGNEEQAVQCEFLARGLGHEQVSKMDGIKGAAKESDAHERKMLKG